MLAVQSGAYDFAPLITGKTVLKFGRSGSPHDRTIKITKDLKVLMWSSGFFSKDTRIYVDKLIKAQPGQFSYSFEKAGAKFRSAELVDRSMSIHYLDDRNVACTLDFIAPTEEDYEYWLKGITFLIDSYKKSRAMMSPDDLRLEYHWTCADIDNSGCLSFSEINTLVQKLNMSISKKSLEVLFKTVDKDGNGSLNFREFIAFMNKIMIKDDLAIIWHNLVNKLPIPASDQPITGQTTEASLKNTISLSQFINFWETCQGQTLTSLEAKEMIMRSYGALDVSAKVDAEMNSTEKKGVFSFGSSASNSSASGGSSSVGSSLGGGDQAAAACKDFKDEDIKITFQMFISTLLKSDNNAAEPSKLQLNQDMSQPISHYFINSSHNTYLEGDQLQSNSSVECYKRALLSGCRCVELDCWDGDDKKHNKQPIIYHGYTLTSKILFKDVIQAIKEVGFKTSNMPIILSLEVHCGLEQQKIMADIMVDLLGSMLARPLESYPNDCLPAPKDLLNKVVLKGKTLRPSKTAATTTTDSTAATEDADASTAAGGGGEGSSSSSHTTVDEDDYDIDDVDDPILKEKMATSKEAALKDKQESKKSEHSHSVHPDLSAIIMLGTGKVNKFTSEARESTPCDLMCSYTEGSMSKHVKKADSFNGWIEHNVRHLSRIYPSGARIDSSNYDPAPAWAAGNQIVALNFQTWDHPMRANKGFFTTNGNCGYILKPSYLLDTTSQVSKIDTSMKLTINVVSASLIPKASDEATSDIVDPYFNVFVDGVLADKSKQTSKTITDNGFNPIFNSVMKFDISRPDTAVITFEVMDNNLGKDTLIGFNSFAVSSLRNGFRNVPLLDPKGTSGGEYQFASFFVRVNIQKESL